MVGGCREWPGRQGTRAGHQEHGRAALALGGWRLRASSRWAARWGSGGARRTHMSSASLRPACSSASTIARAASSRSRARAAAPSAPTAATYGSLRLRPPGRARGRRACRRAHEGASRSVPHSCAGRHARRRAAPRRGRRIESSAGTRSMTVRTAAPWVLVITASGCFALGLPVLSDRGRGSRHAASERLDRFAVIQPPRRAARRP